MIDQGFIDLNKEGQPLKLDLPEKKASLEPHSIGFLPNGDLITVSSEYLKIYKYSFINATFWEYSQIYDIEIHKSLNKRDIGRFIYEKRLFLFNEGLVTQWD